MYVQIVTFQLQGLDAAQYRAATEEFAPLFADLPGLHAKLWLADIATNTFGGVYLWQDRAAMDAYCTSDVFRAMLANPHFVAVRSVGYAILAAPTSQTWKLGAAVPTALQLLNTHVTGDIHLRDGVMVEIGTAPNTEDHNAPR